MSTTIIKIDMDFVFNEIALSFLKENYVQNKEFRCGLLRILLEKNENLRATHWSPWYYTNITLILVYKM